MAEVLKGDLAQLSLLDILKMLSAGQRSGRLDIHQGAKSGEIYLQNGTLIHAVSGAHLGEQVVYTLMGWLEGDFSFMKDISKEEDSDDDR